MWIVWLIGLVALGAETPVLVPTFRFPMTLNHYATAEKHLIETMAGGVAAWRRGGV